MKNTNRSILHDCKNTLKLIEQFSELESFLNDFNFLIFGRDSIICRNYVFSLQIILNSALATLGNIIEFCKCFCLADAYTLLRKYRDDLFFCLYLVIYDTNVKLETTKNTNKMENNIKRWCKNNLNDLNISDGIVNICTVRKYTKFPISYF